MKNIFEIRKTTRDDYETVLSVYAAARKFMAETGNPNQWKDFKPLPSLIEKDIREGVSYVCTEKGRIVGVFALLEGEDPTYKVIDGGKWLSDDPYFVVHRIASDGSVRGVGTFMMEWAYSRKGNIRIDTHRDNTVMQNMLKKLGYTYCGIIYLEDGDERLAYQKN